jgi:assimilatory nitrate reductase catalytic subunit
VVVVAAGTQTHCPYCSLQCGISLRPAGGGLRVEPLADFPTSLGGLCAKGWSAADLLDHPDRLRQPLVRADRDSPLRPASWDEALGRITTAVQAAQREHGADAVGCFGGGGLTNEKAYALGKFARAVLGTSAIDYNGRWCMSSAAAAANRTLGIDRGLPFPLADIAGADAVLVAGGNPAETLPPAMRFFDAGRSRGARHIVVDPGATLHLQPTPGTDLALANGLLHLVIRKSYVDTQYVAARTTGWADVAASAAAYWPDRVERITGVPAADLAAAAEILGTARSAMILTARGAEQHSTGTDITQAYLNLALALGLPGRPYSGYGTVTGQGNGQGGREHGQKADQLPGYRAITDPAARAHVAAVWGIDPAALPGPGRSAWELLDTLGTPGGVRVLLLFASNPVVSAPDSGRVTDRLRALDFLAVADIFASETAALADVVLPSTQWAEEHGTMTNLEGRVIRRRQAVRPPAGVRDDLAVLADLAARLGHPEMLGPDPAAVFDELRRASAGGRADYAGISYERIDAEQGVFWPCPTAGHPGTPRLFAERFPTADGRARFHRVEHRDPVEPTDRDYPYVLTTGRLMRQYQSGTQTRRVPALTGAAVQPYAEIHPDLAARHGIGAGDTVLLRTRRGQADFPARLTAAIRPDTVFVPFHWVGANLLTNPALDPHSRMPAFKACAVAIGPAAPAGERTTAVHATPRFLQCVVGFTGLGLDKPVPLHPALRYEVPDGVTAQPVYLRGGNSTDELICLVLVRDGRTVRWFPVGAKGGTHVPLRVVEDLPPGTVVEVQLTAPEGLTGTVVVDLGLVEV